MLSWPFQSFSPQIAAAIYDRHHEGVLIVDSQGRLIYYNQRMSELDGLAAEDVIGRHILDVYELSAEHCVSTRALTLRQPVLNTALYYRATEGKLVNALTNAYPIFENGCLQGVICYTAEYTALADRLEITARNYDSHIHSKSKDNESLKDYAAKYSMSSIIGDSQAIKSALAAAKVAATTPSSVLICGETGCGKELFAQAIHNHSPRRTRPFCPINCAAIPENLLEGILFGTVKGAFTGSQDKKGLFEISSGGTIFLDEINSLPVGLQSKLLRALQERRIRRVGGSEEIAVDLKIISSANQSPEECVAGGQLRPDLFYRLAVLIVHIPPLRNRLSDIEPLLESFIKKYNKRFNGRVRRVEPEFLALLRSYHWPGNVRELEHVVETSMNFAVTDANNDRTLGLRHLQSSHLRKFLLKNSKTQVQAPASTQTPAASLSAQPPPFVEPPLPSVPTGSPLRLSLNEELARYERGLMETAVRQAEGNLALAARRLGLPRQNFYYRWKKLQNSGD